MADWLQHDFSGVIIEYRREAQEQFFALIPVEYSEKRAVLNARQPVVETGFGYSQSDLVVLDVVNNQRPQLFHRLDLNGLNKNFSQVDQKDRRCEAREESTSGGILRSYVGARRASATKQMCLFHQPVHHLKLNALYWPSPRRNVASRRACIWM